MKAFNPETFRLLKNFMDQQLQKMENQETIKDQVKSILMASMQYHFPDIETVAQKLHISSRTLQRYLSNENTSFIQILKDTKFDLAKRLLKQKGLTISEIGFTLGYSDISNFSRSFKKYQGVSPLEFRKNLAKK
jgi:AraC-like DNA-binding protein